MLWQTLSDAFLPNLYYFDEILKEMKVTPYLEEATVTSRGVDPHSVTGSTSQRPVTSDSQSGLFLRLFSIKHIRDVEGDKGDCVSTTTLDRCKD